MVSARMIYQCSLVASRDFICQFRDQKLLQLFLFRLMIFLRFVTTSVRVQANAAIKPPPLVPVITYYVRDENIGSYIWKKSLI